MPETHIFRKTRKDMTHSVISIDSIILNSMSTDSSAGKVLDSWLQGRFDPHPGRDAMSLYEQDAAFLSLSPTGSTIFFHALARRLMETENFMRNTLAFLPKSARSHYSKR